MTDARPAAASGAERRGGVVLAALSLLAAVAGGAAWLGTRHAGEPEAALSAGTAEPAEPRLPRQCRWQLEQETVYRLSGQSTVFADPRVLTPEGGGEPVEVRTDLEATLHLRPRARGPDDSFVVAALLAGVQLTTNGQPQPRPEGRPFWVRAHPDCRFSAFAFDDRTATDELLLAQGLLQRLEVVLAPDSTEWRRDRFDQNGTVQVRYLADGRRLRRMREAYLEFWPAQGMASLEGFAHTIPRSSALATFSPAGPWLQTLSGRERQRVSYAGKHASTTRERFSLRRVEAPQRLATAPADARAAAWRLASLAPPQPPPMASQQQLPPGEVPPTDDEVAARLEELFAPGGAGMAEALGYLEPLLRSDPEFAARLLELIRADRLSSRAQATSFLALERVGDGPAQRVLREALAGAEGREATRMRAAIAMMGLGAVLSSAIFPPFARFLIDNFGWREAYGVIGVVAVVVDGEVAHRDNRLGGDARRPHGERFVDAMVEMVVKQPHEGCVV